MIPAALLFVAGAAAAPAANARVVAYALELRIDPGSKRLAGRERIVLRTDGAGPAFARFPRHELAVTAVSDDHGRALAVDTAGDEIVVALPPPERRGATREIAVDYAVEDPRGVDFEPDLVYTAFDTCHWMLCHEDPGERARFDLTLVAPPGLVSIASGELLGVHRAVDGTERHRWSEREAYPAYLFGFALGAFRKSSERYHGVTLESYAAASLPETALSALGPTTRAALDFLRERAGRPFPHGTYRQVVVPGGVAQEATSFSLLGWDGLAPMLGDPREDWLIVHEMTHQYWGNLLTCADWSHFWLNEGVTTYLVAAFKQERWGRDAYDRELALFRSRRARAADAGFDVPLAYAGAYPSLAVRRAVVYSKAALFLDTLRAQVGERTFWRALRAYTRGHAGSVTSRDFQRAFEREAKRDLAALFAEWVYDGAARPSG